MCVCVCVYLLVSHSQTHLKRSMGKVGGKILVFFWLLPVVYHLCIASRSSHQLWCCFCVVYVVQSGAKRSPLLYAEKLNLEPKFTVNNVRVVGEICPVQNTLL